MSDRWCDDCSWPYECAAAHACHRAERGERRVAATAEAADAIADGLIAFIAGQKLSVEIVSEGGPDTLLGLKLRNGRGKGARPIPEGGCFTGTVKMTDEQIAFFFGVAGRK